MGYYRSDGERYREEVAEGLAAGARLADLHVAPASGGRVVRATLLVPSGRLEHVETRVVDDAVPTIVDLAPAAGWDEREAHDRDGVRFVGHEPLRPLLRHDLDLATWTVPVAGEEPYEVAVGPIHAGVIESGHFRFHVVGDRILHLDARLFYKHRGLERLAERGTLADALGIATRACAACHVTNAVACAHAVEELRGLAPTPGLARARTLLLELERLWSHLNDVGAVCAGTGMAAGTNAYLALVEEARRLNARLSGHRFLFGAVAVGGSALQLDAAAVADARATLERIREAAATAWRTLVFSRSFADRLRDVGIVPRAAALAGGAVGPALRAAGVAEDERARSPRLAYGGFCARVPERATGDVEARVEQRNLELVQCLDLLEGLLDGPLAPADATPSARPAGTVATGVVESPRGRTVLVLQRDGERVARLRLRTGSYANWPVLAGCAPGNILPDFPLVNKSFELCYACVDR